MGLGGRNKGKVGRGGEKAVAAPAINQGEACAWARDQLRDRPVDDSSRVALGSAPRGWAIPAVGETLLSTRFQGQGCSLTSDPEPGHPLTPWEPRLPKFTLLSAYTALAPGVQRPCLGQQEEEDEEDFSKSFRSWHEVLSLGKINMRFPPGCLGPGFIHHHLKD